jgi:polyisoprenoid-binding protein YceI
VGFTATTTVKRSDFGVTGHLGAVGDEVDVRIEVEASVPPM